MAALEGTLAGTPAESFDPLLEALIKGPLSSYVVLALCNL